MFSHYATRKISTICKFQPFLKTSVFSTHGDIISPCPTLEATLRKEINRLLNKEMFFPFFPQKKSIILVWQSPKYASSFMGKIPNFPLISWCGNFVETHSYRRVSDESPEIRWNYDGILPSGFNKLLKFLAILDSQKF